MPSKSSCSRVPQSAATERTRAILLLSLLVRGAGAARKARAADLKKLYRLIASDERNMVVLKRTRRAAAPSPAPAAEQQINPKPILPHLKRLVDDCL